MKKLITLLLVLAGILSTANAANITRRIWAYCDLDGEWQSSGNSIRIHYYKSDGTDITSWDASGSQYMTRWNSTNWFYYDITADETALSSVKVIIRANSGDKQTYPYNNDEENMDLVNKCYKLKVETISETNRATVSELKYYLLNTNTSTRTEMTTTDCCTFKATIDNQTSPVTNYYVVAPSFAFSDDFSTTYWGLVLRPWKEHQTLAFEDVSGRYYFAEDGNLNSWNTNNVPVHFELSLHTLTWSYDVSAYIERTLPAAAEGYATFSSSYDVIPDPNLESVKYASAINTSTGKITWENFDGTGIHSSDGALLKGTAGETYKFTPATSALAKGTNYLKPIVSETTLAQKGTGTKNYILTKRTTINTDAELCFYLVNALGSKCAAGTAYLEVPTSGEGAREFFPVIWDESASVEGIEVDTQNKGISVYDLQGRRVNNPKKGLYIVNGKKVAIK